jgi:hypothetical protein
MLSSLDRAWVFGLLCSALGCSAPARYAQTAYEAPVTTPDAGGDDAVSCPSSLSGRLSLSQIALDADVRYKQASYDLFPIDEHVAFASTPSGGAYVGWLDDAGGIIRVTPLSQTMLRSGPDVVLPGEDLGALVAHDDGFALLTRRADPGQPPTDPADDESIAKAAFLVRVRGVSEAYAVPLTGTASITHDLYPSARDCVAPFLYGRLAWNGSKYGAYFAVHGCDGDPHAAYYGDKLVYADELGRALKGGWSWNCSLNAGLRLLPEADVFTSVCLSDSQPFTGLNLVVEGVPARQLAPEYVTTGYSAGQFGSLTKLPDGGYMITWLSRGLSGSASHPTAAKQALDIAMLRLGPHYETVGTKKWLVETPSMAEVNLHVAPYGTTRLLVVWDRLTDLHCTSFTCFGTYAATIARLADFDGNFVTPEEHISAPPNNGDDINVFPNGDLGWAFVPDDSRNYTTALTDDRLARLPKKRIINVARLRYCP